MAVLDLLPLQNISLTIGAVRNQAALLGLLHQHLQPLFKFRGATILVNQGARHHRYLTATNLLLEPAPTERPNEGTPYAELLQQPGAQKKALTELGTLARHDPNLRPLRKVGIQQLLGAPLCIGNHPIGFLVLYYAAGELPPTLLPHLQTVAHLVAVAVANVLVNEQVELLQQQLRVPSPGAVSSPRTREELAQTIIEAFRPLLPFEASCLVAYDQHMTYEWCHLGDLPPAVVQDEAVRAYYPQLRPRPDLQAAAAREAWLAEPAISFYSRAQMEEVYQRSGYPILGAVLREGVQESLFLHLRLGNEPVGGLHLYGLEAGRYASYFPMFAYLEHLLEPVAVAVSHALAYEALRAADQEKALQLAVGQALLSRPDEPQFSAVLARELSLVLPWDIFVAARLADIHSVFCQIKDPLTGELGAGSLEAVRDAASLDEVSFNRALLALHPLYAHDGVYAGPAYDDLCTRYQLLRVIQRLYGIRSAQCLPVPMAGDAAMVVLLFSRQPYALDEASLALLQRLRPQLVLGLQNQAAFAQIVALQQQLEAEKTYLVEELNTGYNFSEVVGASTALEQVFQGVNQVGPTDTTVLILGETGTGKELIARAVHHRSPRRERVLVKVNCAALPAQLIESELFGHEKGAFTGATERRIGKFELAHQGTIFLDEIGELPLELQAKLLRVLQEREIERLGGSKVIAVNVRIIAATNRVLADEVAAGRFRADLYYRLNIFPLTLPPLRERPADIPLLADYFGQKFARRMSRPFRGIKQECQQQLQEYPWPGNVRELENIIEHAVIVSQGQPLTCALPPFTPVSVRPDTAAVVGPNEAPASSGLREELDGLERARIKAALDKTHWRIRGENGAAALLNLKPTTLEARMKRLSLR